MKKNINHISLGKAAVIAGLATLLMTLCAPFAELYAYPRLIIPENGAATVGNIAANQTLFALLIVGYLVTFTCDIIAAWALFILLKPVNNGLSALAALFRLVFALVAIVSLLNLVNAFRLVANPYYLTVLKAGQLQAQAMLLFNSFRYGFHFGLVFFGIYLGLLGYLVFVSRYIPRILGLLLAISGLGYFATALQPYLYPSFNLDFAVYTFYGELIFMLWLLIRGWKIQDQSPLDVNPNVSVNPGLQSRT